MSIFFFVIIASKARFASRRRQSGKGASGPQLESGNVYLPHPAIAPWVEGFIDDCSSFPNGKYDDQFDQMTQVLNRLRGATSPATKPVHQPPPQSSGDRSWMR